MAAPTRIRTAYLLTILAAGLITAVHASATNGSPEKTRLSLDDLVTGADAIFVGKVKPATAQWSAKSQLGSLPGTLTWFEVIEGLKGKPTKGRPFSVKQFAPESVPVEPGEVVLWYVVAPPDQFEGPLGESGDFRQVSDPTDTARVLVKNYAGNRGLWGNQPSDRLWNESTFKWSAAATYLDVYLPAHDPKLVDPVVREKRKQEIFAIGNAPCGPNALPLEFLLAATQARLSAR